MLRTNSKTVFLHIKGPFQTVQVWQRCSTSSSRWCWTSC